VNVNLGNRQKGVQLFLGSHILLGDEDNEGEVDAVKIQMMEGETMGQADL